MRPSCFLTIAAMPSILKSKKAAGSFLWPVSTSVKRWGNLPAPRLSTWDYQSVGFSQPTTTVGILYSLRSLRSPSGSEPALVHFRTGVVQPKWSLWSPELWALQAVVGLYKGLSMLHLWGF